MKRSDLKDYFALMESFISGQIQAVEFETSYLAMFKADQRMFPELIFLVLDRLFADVDIFVADPTLRAKLRVEPILQDTLDEAQLLQRAQEAHAKLTKLVSDS